MGRRILWGYLSVILLGCASTEKTEICYVCPEPDKVYFPEDKYTVQDQLAFVNAVKTCIKKGKCLTKFTVVEHGRYHAICGLKEEQICSK